MKTLTCTANKSVPKYMTYTVKDDIALQFSFGIRKQHLNVVRLQSINQLMYFKEKHKLYNLQININHILFNYMTYLW